MRLECGFGLMFLSAVRFLALYGPHDVFRCSRIAPFDTSVVPFPLQKYCEPSGNPC